MLSSWVLAIAGAQAGINRGAMDRSVVVKSPADLYSYANGTWLDTTAIPADRAFVSAFEAARERNLGIMLEIADAAAKRKVGRATRPAVLVGQLFRLAMNVRARNSLKGRPLAAQMKRIGSIHDRASLIKELGRLQSLRVPVGLSWSIARDNTDSRRMLLALAPESRIVSAVQDEDNGERGAAIRAQYLRTMAALATLAKLPDPEGQARAALGIEAALAGTSKTSPSHMRSAMYEPTSIDNLMRLAPHMDWTPFFQELGIPTPDSVNVRQPDFLGRLSSTLVNESVGDWQCYLRCSALYSWAPYLSQAFAKAQFGLASTVGGATGPAPRWKQAVAEIGELTPDALDRLFAEKTFNPASGSAVLEIARRIRTALKMRLRNLSWMSSDTQALAIKKLNALRVLVGAPDQWTDFKGLVLRGDSYVQSALRASLFRSRLEVARLSEPFDSRLWPVRCSTADATYDPHLNTIFVPAGILQPGFFDPEADPAANYGAIGFLIGRAMTKALIGETGRYDLHGNLTDWVSHGDRAQFDLDMEAVLAQYSGYRSPDDLPVDGALTRDEDIADIGGLTLAYAAYRLATGTHNSTDQDGLTADRRFFIAFAQMWRSHYRPSTAAQMIKNDRHAPDEVRVTGAVADQPEFYRAFGMPAPKGLPKVW